MPWPIRNYINHNKILLTHDLRGFANWDKDVMSFTYFIYSVQAEWEPQFSQIIKNQNKWFNSLIKHMNSGFVAFKEKKIEKYNKMFVKIVSDFEESLSIQSLAEDSKNEEIERILKSIDF